MSMITPPTRESRLATTATHAGAGAAVMIVAVFAISALIHLAVAAAIALGAVVLIGAVIWMAFFRKR